MTSMTKQTNPTERADLASAKRVLALESEALQSLSASLNGDFVKALDILGAASGRVVISGMGKSGHVGHKIAATLASTGTPAVFVHPAEASHGDLGMITDKDAVLALSNSGETAELSDLIAYTRRFAIPLIGITSRQNSSLGEAADVALVLPTMSEACPMGLAPTTSTTMMLALGDALAVALLERKGFTAADFQMLHPGGSLGRRLLKVCDLMHAGPEIPVVSPDQAVAETLLVMTNKRFGCAGVVGTDGQLMGIVTDGDLRRHMSSGMLSKTAVEIMTGNPKTVRSQILAAEALRLMNASSITSLFVVDDGKPVGIGLRACIKQ